MRIFSPNIDINDHPIEDNQQYCQLCGQMVPLFEHHICLDALRLKMLEVGKEFETLAEREDRLGISESIEVLEKSLELKLTESQMSNRVSSFANWHRLQCSLFLLI